MRLLSYVLLIWFVSTSFTSGKSFPDLKGETLSGKSRTLPADFLGKKTIVGLAYSDKAREALETWYEPVWEKFVAKVGMFDSQYDVNLCFVPMFIGLNQSLYEPTLKKLRSQNRSDLHPYILFYRGELEPYESALELKDKSEPVFFLLDEKGQILLKITGAYSESKMEKLEGLLE